MARTTAVSASHLSKQASPASRPRGRSSATEKWSVSEDETLRTLRDKGLNWPAISDQLPGRSPVSCRLRYQNYVKRRGTWNGQQSDRLAQLYDERKETMWAELAAELGIPWELAEYMHWRLGEEEMARRVGKKPLTLAATNAEVTAANGPASPARTQPKLRQPQQYQQLPDQSPSEGLDASSHLPVYGSPGPPMTASTLGHVDHTPGTYSWAAFNATPQYWQQHNSASGQQLPSIGELLESIRSGQTSYAGPLLPTQ